MIKTLLIVLCALVTGSHCRWKNYNKELIGKIIHIESLRYRGSWVSAQKLSYNAFYSLRITGAPERNIYYATWSQFRVRDCGNGWVCMESIRYRDNFWIPGSTDNWKNVLAALFKSFYPNNERGYWWKIECESKTFKSCRFYSQFTKTYVEAHDSNAVAVAVFRYPYSAFRILAPNPTERYRTVLETINQTPLTQKKEITLREGVTNTKSTTNKITHTLTLEIGGAFKAVTASAGYELSAEWQHTSSNTYEASREIKYTIDIPPFSKIAFKQLSGQYGPFAVDAKFYLITCINTITKKKCKPQDMKAKKNVMASYNGDDCRFRKVHRLQQLVCV